MVWSYSTWGDNHGTWPAPNGRGWHAYPVRTVRGALGTSRPAPPVTYAARGAGTRSPSVRHGGPRGVRVSRVLDGRDDARDELEEEEEVLLDAHLVRGRVRVRVMLMVMVMVMIGFGFGFGLGLGFGFGFGFGLGLGLGLGLG